MLQKITNTNIYYIIYISYIIVNYTTLKLVNKLSFRILGFLFIYLKRKNIFMNFFKFFKNIKKIKPNSFYFKNFYYKRRISKLVKKKNNNKLNLKNLVSLRKLILKNYCLDFFDLNFKFNRITVKGLSKNTILFKSNLVNLVFLKKFFFYKSPLYQDLIDNLNFVIIFKFKMFKKYNNIKKYTPFNINLLCIALLPKKKHTVYNTFFKKKIYKFGLKKIKFLREKRYSFPIKMRKVRWLKKKRKILLNRKKFSVRTTSSFLRRNLQINSSILFRFFKNYLAIESCIYKLKTLIFKNKKIYLKKKKYNKRDKRTRWFLKRYIYRKSRVLRGFVGLLPLKKVHNNFKIKLFSFKFKKLLRLSNFSLRKRIFIDKYYVNRFLRGFYLKPSKTNFKSLLKGKKFNKFFKQVKYNKLVNIDRPLLSKLREARQVHWNYLKNSTLNERRYKLFLKKTLKKIYNIEQPFWIYILFQVFNRVFSWNHINLILDYKLVVINGSIKYNKLLCEGDIIESTVGLNSLRLIRWYKNLTKKYINRTKRWSYFSYCQRVNKFLKKKKKITKNYKKITYTL